MGYLSDGDASEYGVPRVREVDDVLNWSDRMGSEMPEADFDLHGVRESLSRLNLSVPL